MTTLSMPITDGPQIPRTETTSTLFPGLELTADSSQLPIPDGVPPTVSIAPPTFEAALGAARTPKLPTGMPTIPSSADDKETDATGTDEKEISSKPPHRKKRGEVSLDWMEPSIVIPAQTLVKVNPIRFAAPEVREAGETSSSEISQGVWTRSTPVTIDPALAREHFISVNSNLNAVLKVNTPIFENPDIEKSIEKVSAASDFREMQPMTKEGREIPSATTNGSPVPYVTNTRNLKKEGSKFKSLAADSLAKQPEAELQTETTVIENDAAAPKPVLPKLEIIQGTWKRAALTPLLERQVNGVEKSPFLGDCKALELIGPEFSPEFVETLDYSMGEIDSKDPELEKSHPRLTVPLPEQISTDRLPTKGFSKRLAITSLPRQKQAVQPEFNETLILPPESERQEMPTAFPIPNTNIGSSSIEEPAKTNSAERVVEKPKIVAESIVDAEKPKNGLKSKARETGVNRNLIERFMLEHPVALDEQSPVKSIGTSAASKGLEMKNPVHLNKIAALENGLPEMREVTQSISSKFATSAGQEMPSPSQIHGMSGIMPLPPFKVTDFQVDAAVPPQIHQLVEHLFEKISNESQLLKAKDASSVSFRFQPDGKSDLVIQINREGHGFRVSVGCDEASNAKMSASWSELQDRLKVADIAVEPLKTLPQEQHVTASEKQSGFDLDQQRKGRNPFLQEAREPEMHWAGAMVESPGKRARLTKTMSRNYTGWEGVA